MVQYYVYIMYLRVYFYFLPFYCLFFTIIIVYCNITVLWLLWQTNVPACRTNKGILILILIHFDSYGWMTMKNT